MGKFYLHVYCTMCLFKHNKICLSLFSYIFYVNRSFILEILSNKICSEIWSFKVVRFVAMISNKFCVSSMKFEMIEASPLYTHSLCVIMQKTEPWESEKTVADMEKYLWEMNPSKKTTVDIITAIKQVM